MNLLSLIVAIPLIAFFLLIFFKIKKEQQKALKKTEE